MHYGTARTRCGQNLDFKLKQVYGSAIRELLSTTTGFDLKLSSAEIQIYQNE